MSKRATAVVLTTSLGAVIFCLVLWVLRRELKQYHYHDIVRELHDLPAPAVLLCLLLTALNYWILTAYDVLGLHYLGRSVPYRRTALASFCSYAFSNNVGLSVLGSSAVRYRLYSIWGLGAAEIATIVVFSSISMWIGVLTLAGVSFVVNPLTLPVSLPGPIATTRILGVLFLLLAAAYLAAGALRRQPFKFRSWEFRVPALPIRAAQVCVASLDWTLAAAALYVLLPEAPGLTFAAFLAAFLLAQITGLASHVPGGLGVFETVFLLLLKPYLAAPEVLGPLLAFRGIYYLLPLCTGGLLLGAHEVLLQRETGKRAAVSLGRWGRQAAPDLFAAMAFLGGAVLLLSGAMPSAPARLAALNRFLPLPVMEASHFLGSLAGMGLVLVAWALHRRVDAAYYASITLLGAGIVLSLAKGLNYEEAVALALMLAALIPCHGVFHRKASLFEQRFTLQWAAAIALVLVCTVSLGLFAHKHVAYSSELWWRFGLKEGDAPRFLRATVGAMSLVLFVAAAKLLRPAAPKPRPVTEQDMTAARPVIEASPRTYAYLALLGDKSFLFNNDRTAFIMYAVHQKSWVCLGEPVGPQEEWEGLAWQFREMVDRYGGWTVLYNVGPEALPLCVELGLSMFKMGESAQVPLDGFSLDGPDARELRRTWRKAQNQGCSFELVPASEVPRLLPELRAVSDAWLAEKHTREKGFSLGSFQEDYIRRLPAALVRKDGRIVAFGDVWCGAGKEELSLDLMRHLPDAPGSVMEYLFVEVMLWGKQEGYRYFDLGNVPLAGVEARTVSPLWSKAGAFVYRHGEHFYNFQGLRQYKEKFNPVWEPRYIACPGGLALPRVLLDVTALISGGVKGIVGK